MRIKVEKSSPHKWYRNYVNAIFEVTPNNVGYTLLDTPANRDVLNQERDASRRRELFRRISNTSSAGMKLGVNNKDCRLIQDITSNRQAVQFLSKE